MPWGDRTGPGGFGPRTGRGLGYCSGYSSPGFTRGTPRGGRGFGFGFGRGVGFGRGRGFGFGRGVGRGFGWQTRGFDPAYAEPVMPAAEPYAEPTNADQRAILEDEAKAIEQEQKALKEELDYIKKKLAEFKKQK